MNKEFYALRFAKDKHEGMFAEFLLDEEDDTVTMYASKYPTLVSDDKSEASDILKRLMEKNSDMELILVKVQYSTEDIMTDFDKVESLGALSNPS